MSKRSAKLGGRCCGLGAVLEPRLFKALCDPNRIALLAELARCRRPCSVGEMARCCPVDLSVVSRHLGILRDAGVLEAAKRGKEVYYSVRCTEVSGLLRLIADAIEACCPSPVSTGAKPVAMPKEKNRGNQRERSPKRFKSLRRGRE